MRSFAALYEDLPAYGQRIGDIVDGVRLKIQDVEDAPTAWCFPAGSGSRTRSGKAPSRQPPNRQERPKPRRPPMPAVRHPPKCGFTKSARPSAISLFRQLSSFYQILLMASFVPFLVYFMLSWRDHFNRSFLQFFHGEDRLVAARSLEGVAEMVRAFVVGNFLLGLAAGRRQFA